jgi:hypothetical protein
MSISRYLRGIEAPNQNIEDVSTDAGVALREGLNFEHANNAAHGGYLRHVQGLVMVRLAANRSAPWAGATDSIRHDLQDATRSRP